MNQLEVSTNSMSKDVANLINDYINCDGKSLRQIELYTHVSYNYVRRLSHCSINDESINPIKLCQVIKFIKGTDYAYDVVSKNSDWEKKVKSWIGVGKKLAPKSVERFDLESMIISSEETIITFILASNEKGTSLSELQEAGGQLYVTAAQTLISNDILKETEGKLHSNVLNLLNGEFYTFSREALKKVVPAVSRFYRSEHAGQSRNYIFLGTEMYSKEFILEFYQKVEELRQWYTINSRKPESKGLNPFFFTMMMDTFYDSLVDSKGVLQ
jgi:hypothetical protein